jgi:MobA/MobL family
MAIYHLSAQVISRGAGHSSVHAAAYRARCDLTDERTGLKHDYSRKSGELLFAGIYAPKDAPEWTRDRAQLWNHVEAFEKRRDAQLAREFNIALPHELTLEQARYALQDWIRDNFTRKGLIADAVIHAPGREGDERNMHAHVMVVMRKLDGTEFAARKERSADIADRKAELEKLRESWERIGNRHLERHGHEPTLDRRSLLDQGVDRDPTMHLGKDASAMERRGVATEPGELNRAITAENERRVIDLAAERAMREARAAARGQVDDVRPPDSSRDRARDFSATEAAREAVQAQEPTAAPSAPGQETTRTTPHERGPEQHREPPPAREAPAVIHLGPPAEELSKAEQQALDAGVKVISGIFSGFASMVEKTLGFLADFIAPPPPPTKEQAEGMQRAAEEQQTQAAAEREAAEREARLQELLEQIRRDDLRARLEEQLRRDLGRDRDDDYDRGRERER